MHSAIVRFFDFPLESVSYIDELGSWVSQGLILSCCQGQVTPAELFMKHALVIKNYGVAYGP